MNNFFDFPVFRTACLLLVREKIFLVAIWLFVGVVVAAFGAAQFSGRQPAAVGLDVGISTIRLLLPVIIVLMALALFSREFERRYFLSTLTYPCSRERFLLVRLGALLAFTMGLLVVVAILLGGVVWYCGIEYEQGTPVSLGAPYGVTIAFIALDLLVVSALACLLAVLGSTPGFVLVGTLGVMVVARSYALTINLLVRNSTLVGDAESYSAGVGFLGYLLPDLGGLDVRLIAVYNNMGFLPADWPWLVVSVFAYFFVLVAMAVFLLRRKRFS